MRVFVQFCRARKARDGREGSEEPIRRPPEISSASWNCADDFDYVRRGVSTNTPCFCRNCQNAIVCWNLEGFAEFEWIFWRTLTCSEALIKRQPLLQHHVITHEDTTQYRRQHADQHVNTSHPTHPIHQQEPPASASTDQHRFSSTRTWAPYRYQLHGINLLTKSRFNTE